MKKTIFLLVLLLLAASTALAEYDPIQGAKNDLTEVFGYTVEEAENFEFEDNGIDTVRFWPKDHPDWEWFGAYVKSYKAKALPMLKRFCSAVSKSNGNFVFDAGTVNADESTLVGKFVGLVFGEEEYYSNAGELKTRLYVAREFPVDQIGAQKVPKKKEAEKKGGDFKQGEAFMDVPKTDAGYVPFC